MSIPERLTRSHLLVYEQQLPEELLCLRLLITGIEFVQKITETDIKIIPRRDAVPFLQYLTNLESQS